MRLPEWRLMLLRKFFSERSRRGWGGIWNRLVISFLGFSSAGRLDCFLQLLFVMRCSSDQFRKLPPEPRASFISWLCSRWLLPSEVDRTQHF